ncbi:hypothetical protein ALT1644_240052 [Alteromonas macleodii]
MFLTKVRAMTHFAGYATKLRVFCKNKSKHVRMCSLQFNFYPVSLLICRQNVSGASSYPNRAFKRHTKMLTKCKALRIKMDFIE